MASHSSILACRILMERRAWGATVHGVAEPDTTEQVSTAQKSFTRIRTMDNKSQRIQGNFQGCSPLSLESICKKLGKWRVIFLLLWRETGLSPVKNGEQIKRIMTYSFLIPFLPLQHKQVPFLLPLWLSALYKVQLTYNMKLLNRQIDWLPINFKNDRKTHVKNTKQTFRHSSLYLLSTS